MKSNLTLIILSALFLFAACSDKPSAGRDAASAPAPADSPVTIRPSDNRSSSLPKIVAFGDSLTAGYGLATSESYPALLGGMLERDGYGYEVVNAGVSGDTTTGGVQRIDWALEGDVRMVVLELGANDMLRGLPVKVMKENLAEIIKRAKAHGAQVVLAGMYATTNSGPEYQAEFRDAFESLARRHNVPLIPFFLMRVAGVESLNQADGAHPNAEGTRIVAETVYQAIRPLLDQTEEKASK
ncbi:MAG: arylesterase [Pyrinomonadaceae bacterium]